MMTIASRMSAAASRRRRPAPSTLRHVVLISAHSREDESAQPDAPGWVRGAVEPRRAGDRPDEEGPGAAGLPRACVRCGPPPGQAGCPPVAGSPPRAARNALRQTLFVLRKALGRTEDVTLLVTGDAITLPSQAPQTDVVAFEHAV